MEKLLEKFLPISLVLIALAALIAVLAAISGATVQVPGLGAFSVRWSEELAGWSRVSEARAFDIRCEYLVQTDLWADDASGTASYHAGVVDEAFVYEEIGSNQYVYVASDRPTEARFGDWAGVHEAGGEKAWNRAPAVLFQRCF
ncbi:MAG TPA: hypothetical protein VFR34_12045 [Paracoccaceae bacterium]|nr:hypothetical protein [Paracoccaceae bacterium]